MVVAKGDEGVREIGQGVKNYKLPIINCEASSRWFTDLRKCTVLIFTNCVILFVSSIKFLGGGETVYL